MRKLDAERWQQIEPVLDAALDREPADWPDLVDALCAGDAELREDVQSLLDRVRLLPGFLERRSDKGAASLLPTSHETGPATPPLP